VTIFIGYIVISPSLVLLGIELARIVKAEAAVVHWASILVLFCDSAFGKGQQMKANISRAFGRTER
jgi:hypothetical protein